MKKYKKFERGSGALLHITSLPGNYGIGDIGAAAFRFIDFLREAGQRYWQFLPVNPVSMEFDNSPYMCLSAFAGNPLLIDPGELLAAGFLAEEDIGQLPDFSRYAVEFDKVIPFKTMLLQRAFDRFKRSGAGSAFDAFCRRQHWLDDFCLFMALRTENNKKPWSQWPAEAATRDRKAMLACKERLADAVLFHKFVQFCFFSQWDRLKKYAEQQNILLIGDIPIYVSWDSADVWANQNCFLLDDRTFKPTHVAGVPPDYFSATGQRWGNPLYRWKDAGGRANRTLYSWWGERFKAVFHCVDIVRIDHFRGFESFWQIPAAEKTAINGKWVQGPGRGFFKSMEKKLGRLGIIAEDLGIITPEVEKLRDDCGYPGMKILQFAFDSDQNNSYLPHNYPTTNCVVYTGTHDNDTTLGWYLSERVPDSSKERAVRYGNCPGSDHIAWDFIRMAFSSTADIAIIPMQDILGFGSDCRMNIPSTAEGNWRWRCGPEYLNSETAARLRDETLFYGRINTRI